MPLGAPHEVCASPTSGLLRTSPLTTNQVGPARRPQPPSYGLPFGQSVPQGRLRVRCIRASRHSILFSNVLLLTYSIIRRICTTVECTRGRGTDVEVGSRNAPLPSSTTKNKQCLSFRSRSAQSSFAAAAHLQLALSDLLVNLDDLGDPADFSGSSLPSPEFHSRVCFPFTARLSRFPAHCSSRVLILECLSRVLVIDTQLAG